MNYLIIGGSKSGKSEVGEKIALTLSRKPKSENRNFTFRSSNFPLWASMIWCESLTQRTHVSRVSLSREPKSMILSESLTQRMNMSRVSLNKVIYIATMKPYDKEDEERIRKHIQNRVGLNFITFEVQRNLHEIVKSIHQNDTVLIDSITSLLTNEMFVGAEIIKNPSKNILNGLKQIMFKAQNAIIVSDYIFNDAIEYDEVTENFKRELAILNKELAKICDNVMECSFGNIRYIKYEEKTVL